MAGMEGAILDECDKLYCTGCSNLISRICKEFREANDQLVQEMKELKDICNGMENALEGVKNELEILRGKEMDGKKEVEEVKRSIEGVKKESVMRKDVEDVKRTVEEVQRDGKKEVDEVKRSMEVIKKEAMVRREVEDVKREVEEVKMNGKKEVDEVRRNVDLFKKETVMRKEVEDVRRVMEEIKRDGKKDVEEVKKSMELMRKETVLKKEVEEVKRVVEDMKKDGLLKKDVEEEVKKSFAEIVASEKENEEKSENSRAKEREMEMRVREVMEREKRKLNMVFMGLPEKDDENDKNDIRKILDALVPEMNIEFELIGRIGRSEKRPVRVRMIDAADKRRVLSRAKLLKQKTEFDRVYIVPDLTRMQQDEDKILREEVKNRRNAGALNVRIVNGRVVEGIVNEANVVNVGASVNTV